MFPLSFVHVSILKIHSSLTVLESVLESSFINIAVDPIHFSITSKFIFKKISFVNPLFIIQHPVSVFEIVHPCSIINKNIISDVEQLSLSSFSMVLVISHIHNSIQIFVGSYSVPLTMTTFNISQIKSSILVLQNSFSVKLMINIVFLLAYGKQLFILGLDTYRVLNTILLKPIMN